MLVGIYEIDVYGEALRSPGGAITVDFLDIPDLQVFAEHRSSASHAFTVQSYGNRLFS